MLTFWGKLAACLAKGAPAPLPFPPEQRVILLISEEYPLAEVYAIPSGWDDDDVSRYINESSEGWSTAAVVTVKEIEE